jgi:hypothetical protein
MNLYILQTLRYVGIGLGIIRVLFLFKQGVIEYIKFRDYLFGITDYEMLIAIGGYR